MPQELEFSMQGGACLARRPGSEEIAIGFALVHGVEARVFFSNFSS